MLHKLPNVFAELVKDVVGLDEHKKYWFSQTCNSFAQVVEILLQVSLVVGFATFVNAIYYLNEYPLLLDPIVTFSSLFLFKK